MGIIGATVPPYVPIKVHFAWARHGQSLRRLTRMAFFYLLFTTLLFADSISIRPRRYPVTASHSRQVRRPKIKVVGIKVAHLPSRLVPAKRAFRSESVASLLTCSINR